MTPCSSPPSPAPLSRRRARASCVPPPAPLPPPQSAFSPLRRENTAPLCAVATLPREEQRSRNAVRPPRADKAARPRTGAAAAASRAPAAAPVVPPAFDLGRCLNCHRCGVLPNQMVVVVDDEGNRFCSPECGWTFMFLPVEAQQTRLIASQYVRLPDPYTAPPDPVKQMHQEAANADRIVHQQADRMRKDKHYRKQMQLAKEERLAKGIHLPYDNKPRTRLCSAPPASHYTPAPVEPELEAHADALFRFGMFLAD